MAHRQGPNQPMKGNHTIGRVRAQSPTSDPARLSPSPRQNACRSIKPLLRGHQQNRYPCFCCSFAHRGRASSVGHRLSLRTTRALCRAWLCGEAAERCALAPTLTPSLLEDSLLVWRPRLVPLLNPKLSKTIDFHCLDPTPPMYFWNRSHEETQ